MNGTIDTLKLKIINNEDFTYQNLVNFIENKIQEKQNIFIRLKEEIHLDKESEKHELIINYIKKHSDPRDLLDEIVKSYRKPWLLFSFKLSRADAIILESFLHIMKNDERFFYDGCRWTSVDVVEKEIGPLVKNFYKKIFPKEKEVRTKEIYDALEELEWTRQPPLIKLTRPRPGRIKGNPIDRKRKRYCLTDDGVNEIVSFAALQICNDLDLLEKRIRTGKK